VPLVAGGNHQTWLSCEHTLPSAVTLVNVLMGGTSWLTR
jgi:hypothetical protein